MQKMHTLKERTLVTLDGSRIQGPKDLSGKLLGNAGHKIPLEDAIALGLADADEQPEKKEKLPGEKKEKLPGEKK